MIDIDILDRRKSLFYNDVSDNESEIIEKVQSSKFLVIGAAGSIGQAVAKEIFLRKPKMLHLVDINENNLVELVRDIRSSLGYLKGEFETFTIDCGSNHFSSFFNFYGNYDYVLNLSALKHVRNEKDPYTLMRMIEVNIINSLKVLKLIKKVNVKNYFSVSTDKASNPINLMGATKLMMENCLIKESINQNISLARFANVAFSDGSLLHGFNMRFYKNQPIAVPSDIKRYFISGKESGELCLMSCLLGQNREIFFPKQDKIFKPKTFIEILEKYLNKKGFEIFECENENEAREKSNELIKQKKWPCFLFKSDTTGEKNIEDFYCSNEKVNLKKYTNIGIILKEISSKNISDFSNFETELEKFFIEKKYSKKEIISLFEKYLLNFNHLDKGKYLESKM